jgi:hypothetical protein
MTLDSCGSLVDNLWSTHSKRNAAHQAQHDNCNCNISLKGRRDLGLPNTGCFRKKGKRNAARKEELNGIYMIWNI